MLKIVREITSMSPDASVELSALGDLYFCVSLIDKGRSLSIS